MGEGDKKTAVARLGKVWFLRDDLYVVEAYCIAGIFCLAKFFTKAQSTVLQKNFRFYSIAKKKKKRENYTYLLYTL